MSFKPSIDEIASLAKRRGFILIVVISMAVMLVFTIMDHMEPS